MLLSKGGNPIGIRMTYSIEFPSTGYRAPSPFLTPEDPYLNESSVSFSMRGINQSITPTLERENLSHRGVRYSFATDLIPAFIQENKSETRLCISQAFAGPMQARVEEILRTPKGEKKTRFRVAISDTDYGMRESRGGDQFTQGAYSLKTFYESAVRDGARDCGSNTNNASEPILAPPQDSR